MPLLGSKERIFATQKPLALLKRIIQASSNEGDIVLDPFCGCGTTVVAAHQLKRKFVGIDISLFTVQSVVRVWLQEIGLRDIQIAGIPEDLASARKLAVDDPFAFESFAIDLCHPAFVANKDQRKDGGVDGRGFLLHPVKEKGKKKRAILAHVDVESLKELTLPQPENVRRWNYDNLPHEEHWQPVNPIEWEPDSWEEVEKED